MKLARAIQCFARDDAAQSLIEYALIACMIGLGAAFALTNLKTVIASLFSRIGNVISNTL